MIVSFLCFQFYRHWFQVGGNEKNRCVLGPVEGKKEEEKQVSQPQCPWNRLSFEICNKIGVNITEKANTTSQQFHKLIDVTN